MGLFKKKFSSKELDYEAINEFATSGGKVNKLLEVLIILCIIGAGIIILQKTRILPIIIDFLGVISPVFIGLAIAWIVSPLADKLDKKMPRILACLIVYIIIIGVLVLILTYTIPSIVSQVKALSGKIPGMVDELKSIFTYITKKLNLSKTYSFTNIINNLDSLNANNITDMIIGGATSIVSMLTTIFLSLMVGFYFLLDYHKITAKIYKIIPEKYKDDARELARRSNQSLRGYIQGVLIVMFFVFISQTIGLTLAGHEAPMLFGLICAITDVIPFFGPWIGGIPAVIVGFLISPLTGVLTLVSIFIVQALENNIYQPIIMGHTMKLHPVTIIASLLVFGHFFGILGMIIATPAVATLKLLFTFIDEKINLTDKIKNVG